MAIDAQRTEYAAYLPKWQLVDDMCDEKNLDDHIPDLDVLGDDVARDGTRTKNDRFKERASFFGASRQTLQGLIGTAFEQDPTITLPAQLEYLLTNADGTGVDLYQQIQEAVGEGLRKAGGGIFVTMPETGGEVSLADQESLRFVATIHLIERQRLINWWTQTEGAETFLGGVIFTEVDETIDEEYNVEETEVCRELALDEDGNFFDRKWIKTKGGWEPQEAVYPTQGNGQFWRRIPFMFFGAERNSWQIQTPPLLSIARKNRDHLRNSAVNEEGIWFSGHIQPVADEMDPEAFDTIASKGFVIGGGTMMVAKGFRYEVAEPNTAARQGMIDKAEEMAALGARLLQPGTVAKTATQSSGEEKVQHSVLSLVVTNVSDAYTWALEQAANYMNASGDVLVEISKSFMEPEVTVEKMREMRENLLSGVIGPQEMYKSLRNSGVIDSEKTEDEYMGELSERGVLFTASEDDAGNVVEFESALIEGLTGGR